MVSSGVITARELLRLRLESQWIAAPSAPAPSAAGAPAARRSIVDVAHHLLALQAQDFGQAVWALGLRSPGSTRDDLTAALDSGQLVRSWPMRGTLHFSTPDDLRRMLALTATRTVTGAATRHRQLGIDDTVLGRARDVAVAELSGGGSLSRDEFFSFLQAAGIETTGQRGVHLIWLLAHEGLVCWGPSRGTQQALVLLDEWAPPIRQPGRDEGLGEFVLRYFMGHGPATLADFCWWSKVTVADAKRGFALVRERLDEVDVEGTSHWLAARDPAFPDAPPSPRARAGTHALPGFDEYLLGYRNRCPALAPEFFDRIVPGNNGIFLPMLISHGEIVGTWKRATTARGVTITTSPFRPLRASEQASFERDLRRYARFLGRPATITADTP
jgi:hypothetical protein